VARGEALQHRCPVAAKKQRLPRSLLLEDEQEAARGRSAQDISEEDRGKVWRKKELSR